MIWGWNTAPGGSRPTPIRLSVDTHCHALIVGSSGSGKSYALLYLLGSLLQDKPDTVVFFCDFKNSTDFSFLEGYSYYYAGDDCVRGVTEFYKRFHEARQNQNTMQRYVLIFDEFPAFVNFLSIKDKAEKTKNGAEMQGIIAEILMLGRGIKFGIWIVTQRADASLFSNGARDNFMIIVGLGRMSREQKGMIFSGEDLPDKIYHQGEGVLLADGQALREVKFLKIRNAVDWKWHIRQILDGKIV